MKGDTTAVYGEISFESHTSSFVTPEFYGAYILYIQNFLKFICGHFYSKKILQRN